MLERAASLVFSEVSARFSKRVRPRRSCGLRRSNASRACLICRHSDAVASANFFYDTRSQGVCCSVNSGITSGNALYGDLTAVYKIGKWSVLARLATSKCRRPATPGRLHPGTGREPLRPLPDRRCRWVGWL